MNPKYESKEKMSIKLITIILITKLIILKE